MNLARLNHILIPKTKAERDRFRQGRTHRMFSFIIAFWGSLTREGRFLFVFWPLLGAISLNIRYSQSYLLFSALTGLLLAAVMLRGLFRLRDVQVTISAPLRVTVGEAISLAVAVHNRGDRLHQALRVRGPFLPWDGRYDSSSSGIPQLPPGAETGVLFRATFSERGEHHLDPFSVRALLPLGQLPLQHQTQDVSQPAPPSQHLGQPLYAQPIPAPNFRLPCPSADPVPMRQ